MTLSATPTLIRAPGRLVISPTDLTAAFPYGGTELGSVRQVTWTRFSVDFAIIAEEFGMPVEYNQAGEAWGISAFMRGQDDDFVSTLFPNASAGTVSQHQGYTWPGTNKAGSWRSADGVKLLFAPFNTTDVNAIILYRGIPLQEDAARMALDWGDEFGVPVVFMGILDTGGNGGQWRRLKDITVSP